MTPWRCYRPRWTSVAVRAVYPICLTGTGLCIAGYLAYDNPTLPFTIILAGLFLSVIGWGEWRGVTQGVYECESGLRCNTALHSYVLPWRELSEFTSRRVMTWDRVFAKQTNGRFKPIPTLLQGQRVIWADGETRNIVDVLNERLEEWRGLHHPTGQEMGHAPAAQHADIKSGG
jgi:hypothetical protein